MMRRSFYECYGTMMQAMTGTRRWHLSTSFGMPFDRAAPRRLMTKPPTRPAYVSAVSAEWP